MGSLPEFVGFVTWVHHSWLKASCDSTLILVCVFVVSLVVVDFFFFFQRGRRGRRRVSQLFGFLLWNLSVENSNSRQIFIEIESMILNLLQRSQPSHSRDVSLLNNLETILTNKIVIIFVLFSKKKILTQWHVAKKRTFFFNIR